jgi:hypothetical protein
MGARKTAYLPPIELLKQLSLRSILFEYFRWSCHRLMRFMYQIFSYARMHIIPCQKIYPLQPPALNL